MRLARPEYLQQAFEDVGTSLHAGETRESTAALLGVVPASIIAIAAPLLAWLVSFSFFH